MTTNVDQNKLEGKVKRPENKKETQDGNVYKGDGPSKGFEDVGGRDVVCVYVWKEQETLSHVRQGRGLRKRQQGSDSIDEEENPQHHRSLVSRTVFHLGVIYN